MAAIPIDIYGDIMSGKSFARTFIKKGEECFVIAPTSQSSFLTTSDGNPVKPFDCTYTIKGKDYKLSDLAVSQDKTLVQTLLTVAKDTTNTLKSVEGNYTQCTLMDIQVILRFINKNMLHIKNIFIADFTHFLTQQITSLGFRNRKDGGEAFARYVDLASDTMQNMVYVANILRSDILLFKEYHIDFNQDTKKFNYFVPQGKQLCGNFKIEGVSNYLFAAIPKLDEDTGELEEYRFATKPIGGYHARTLGIFDTTFIPNDLEFIITKIREKEGI
jgi:hypothetical protein